MRRFVLSIVKPFRSVPHIWGLFCQGDKKNVAFDEMRKILGRVFD